MRYSLGSESCAKRLMVAFVWAVVLAVAVVPSLPCLAEPTYGGTLVLTSTDPARMNPVLQWDFRQVVNLVYEGLVEFDLDGNPIPLLADQWTISTDGLTYTFTLKPGVLFSDGKALTADDVVFTYELILEPGSVSPFASEFEVVESVRAVSPLTVEFRLSGPQATFLGKLWLGILPKHIWENESLMESRFNTQPIGTGPWVLESWTRLDTMRFRANELYHDGRPYLDALVLKVIPDATVAFAALQRGDIDFLPFTGIVGGVPYEQIPALKANRNLVVHLYEVPQPQTLWLRVDEPPFDNLLVRHAIAHAIDREFIVERLLFGYGIVEHSQVPRPIGWAYNPDVRRYEYDPATAEQLLDAAGFPRGANGVRFETTIYGTPGARQVLCELLQEYFRAIGISAKIDISDWTTYMNKVRNDRTARGMWSIIAIPALPDPDLGTIYVASEEIKPGGRNPSQYSNPRVDELIALGRTTTDQAERREIYLEYQEILAEDCPGIPLYILTAVDVWNARFTGFCPTQWGAGSFKCLRLVYETK